MPEKWAHRRSCVWAVRSSSVKLLEGSSYAHISTVWGDCWGRGDLGGGSPGPNTDPRPLLQSVYSHWEVLGGSVTCLTPIARERLTTLLDLNPSLWDSVTSGFSFSILSQPLAKVLGLFLGLIGYTLLSALLSIA